MKTVNHLQEKPEDVVWPLCGHCITVVEECGKSGQQLRGQSFVIRSHGADATEHVVS